ncbi:MAG: lipopolysaccharide biosynthesis protein [Phycisphaerae bacterium]|jgi:O-antigen/teichoic acid export membrane protein
MSIVRSAILLSGAEYVGMALGLAEAMILSRALGSSGVGQYSLVRQTLIFAVQIASLGLPTASIYAINSRKLDPSRTVVTCLYACLATSAVMGVVLWALFGLGEQFFGALPAWTILACVGYVPLILARQCFSQLNMAWMRALPLVLVRVVPDFCYMVLVAGMFFLARRWIQVNLMIALPIMVAFIGLGIAYGSLWNRISLRAKADWGFLRLGVPLGVQIVATDMLTIVNSYVAMTILKAFRGFSDVGYFSRASQVAMLVATAGVGFYTLLYSRWSAMEGEEQRLHVQHTLGLTTAAAVIGCGTILLFAHYVVLILYGRQFLPAVWPTRLLVGGSVFFFLARALQGLFTANGKPIYNIVTLGLSGLVNLLLCLVLVPAYGTGGAAIAGLIACLAGGIAAVYIACTRYNLRLMGILLPSRHAIRLAFASLTSRKSRADETGGGP